MGITDGREMMSLAAARTAFQIGKPAGAIGRWTPARTSSGAPAVVGVIYLQAVRLVRWPDGRWVAGHRLADGAGRHDPKYWDHLASAATLADAHAAAWRILAPGAGVLEQLAAEGVPVNMDGLA